MKKVFSILFASLILLSGMHLSIATHYCKGKVAAVKWSFSAENATCGMETSQLKCPSSAGISTNCCHNQIAFFKVDNNYNPSSFQIKEVAKNLNQIFIIPLSHLSTSYEPSNFLIANNSPPKNFQVSDVYLADICVFRI